MPKTKAEKREYMKAYMPVDVRRSRPGRTGRRPGDDRPPVAHAGTRRVHRRAGRRRLCPRFPRMGVQAVFSVGNRPRRMPQERRSGAPRYPSTGQK